MHSETSTNQLGPVGRFFFGRIFPWLFLIAGAVVLFLGIRSMHRAKESTHWPSVSGVVVSSSIDRNSGSNGATTYKAKVLYDYEVNGVTYASNRIGYGDFGSSNPSRARKIVNQYPKGKYVDVFYMPDNAGESVLETGIQKRTYIMLAFGAVFFLAGVATLIYIPRAIRKRAQEVQEAASGDLHPH